MQDRLTGFNTDTHNLTGPELYPRLSLDERGGYLHDDGFDRVRAAPALLGQEFHADSPAPEHVSAGDHWMHDSYERRFERIGVLQE